MSTSDMTEAEVKIENEKLRAEVSKLFAEVSKLAADTERSKVDTAKILAEAGHLKMSTVLAPIFAGAGLVGATAAATATIVKLFS